MEAERLSEPGDYESTKKAVALLREAIEEEPNYLYSYFRLFYMLSWEFNFLVGEYESILKERAEIVIKMQEISPRAGKCSNGIYQ